MTPSDLPFQVTLRVLPGITLEVAQAGPFDGPLVILLHGFPDSWQTWHSQIAALTKSGFRVFAPNQRGYGRSEKPRGIKSYDIDKLAADVVDLATSDGYEKFHLVGHDWGGIVAFWIASKFPGKVKRLAVLNAPHPGVFKSYLISHPSQLLRSWYVGFFQIPVLPEWLLAAHDHALLFRGFEQTSRPGTFDRSDRRYLTIGWREKGALNAMLNYYRAIVRRSEDSLRLPVSVPTKILFGRHDPTEEPGLASASFDLCNNAEILWFEESRHWPHREEPDRMNNALVDFFSASEL